MMSFSLSGGVEVVGFISPTDPLDTYPVIDPLYGIDGLRNVNTLTDLNNIPDLRRRAGMLVGVNNGSQFYKLNASPWNGTITDWTLVNFGGADTYVTGTTFNSNQAILTRNDSVEVFKLSGGTNVLLSNPSTNEIVINVSADVDTNTFVTGFTYDNSNNLTINRNDGVDFSVNVDTMSGLTINGDLLVTGTTNISGLTSINSSLDVYNGTIGLRTNDYFLQGTSTGGTNVQLIGVYSNDEILIGNQGYTNRIMDDTIINGQLSVLSGLTVNGPLSACTGIYTSNIYGCSPITINDIAIFQQGLDVITGDTILQQTSATTITLTNLPNLNNTATEILARNSSTGLVEYRDVNTITPDTNIFVTGFTYDNVNTFTISRSDGVILPATISVLSGITYYGDGSNLSGVTSDNFYVTGGTYNSSTDTLTLLRNDGNFVNITGITDTFTIGATYDNGTATATFTRNDGNTYTLDLSTIDVNDTFVTGFTYNNANTFTISRNDGVDLNSSFNTVTGLTVNGTLDATTILSGGTNLTTIIESLDTNTFVSGGTYNTGTQEINFVGNSPETTFDVDLSSIISTDTYVTGFTFNPSTYDLTIRQNEGQPNLVSNLAVLATDVYVVSGVYNPSTGIVTYTNSSGGTFQVSGFTTGMTDSYTTDAYLSGTEIRFDNNIQGVNFYNVDLLPVLSGKTDLTLFNSHTADTNNPHQTSFNNLTSTAHTHTISDVINLQTELDSKLDTTTFNTYTANTQTILDGKIDSANNVGGANEFFKDKSGTTLNFRTLSGGTNTTVSTVGDIIKVDTVDLFTTGATYDNGTALATFTKNDGTTYTLDLSSIDVNDTFITGFTYNNANTFTLNRNDGVELNTTINNVSGLTVNGTLSALTIDGGTILSGGTNLSSVIESLDTYVTGGTVSISGTDNSNNGTIGLFYKNSDGTPRTLPFEDTFTTGGTYDNGTALITFDKNDGTTYNVDLSTLDLNDTFVTGFTYDGINTFTITRNDDVSINSTINILSGITYYGSGIGLTNIPISGVTNLQTVLDGKTDLTLFNTHTGDTNNPHQTSFSNLTSTAHTHTISEVIDLQTELDSKIDSDVTNSGEIALIKSTGVVESSNDITYTLTGSTNSKPTIGIGLGGAANTKGALEINSYVDFNGQPFDYFIYTGVGGSFQNFAGAGLFAISVHTVGRFMGSGIHIFSDERIKKDIKVSNSKEDLETISKLEICDYKYIDVVKGGAEKKVIAQQVKKHYPIAVKEGIDIIPCFMEKGEIKDGIINLQLDCIVGDKIKLIFPNGKEELTQVIEVNQKSIKVDCSENDDVFVYGKEVNDYQTVDYDALSMLNISATQELYKIIKDLKAEIEELKKTCKK